MTEDSDGHLFVPIAANWLASGTDDVYVVYYECMRALYMHVSLCMHMYMYVCIYICMYYYDVCILDQV